MRGEAVASQTVTQQPCLAHGYHGAAAVQALVQDTPLMNRERDMVELKISSL